MNFRVTQRIQARPYEADGHYNCLTYRLHGSEDVEKGELELDLNHFLPGGGVAQAPAQLETIYYVQVGEITAILDEGREEILHVGDSLHFGRGFACGLKNASCTPAQVLTMRVCPRVPAEGVPADTKWKITRADEFYSYAPVPDTHKNCLTCRLHNAKDVNQGRFEVGISFYLPGGGVHMPGDQYEMIYYVTEGEFTCPTPEEGECAMGPGDSVHWGARNFRICKNTGWDTVTMITIRVLPEGDPLCGE